MKAPAMLPAKKLLVPLSAGNIDLIRRALRYYAHAEQSALHDAAKEKQRDPDHYRDVRRQVMPRIQCAEELCAKLLHDPTGAG